MAAMFTALRARRLASARSTLRHDVFWVSSAPTITSKRLRALQEDSRPPFRATAEGAESRAPHMRWFPTSTSFAFRSADLMDARSVAVT